MSGSYDNETPPVARVYLQEDLLLQRNNLLSKVHREDNTAIKVDGIADLTSNIAASLEIMSQKSQDRFEVIMKRIEDLREYFAASIDYLADQQAATTLRLDNMVTKERFEEGMAEIRRNFAAQRKQMDVLLGQQRPKI